MVSQNYVPAFSFGGCIYTTIIESSCVLLACTLKHTAINDLTIDVKLGSRTENNLTFDDEQKKGLLDQFSCLRFWYADTLNVSQTTIVKCQ